MKYAIIGIIVVMFPLSAFGSIWFAGTGNDGYIYDVNGLFSVLSNSSFMPDISANSFIYENHSGSAIQGSIDSISTLVQQDDVLLWFYSGHGSFTTDDDLDETDQGSTALDAYDETIGLLNNPDIITDDELALSFRSLSLSGATIITIFDTCYAGGFVGGTGDLNTIPGLTFFGSSAEYEDSYSFANEPYSIFTQGLILGIEDFNADVNNDGTLLAYEWFDFAYDYTTGRVSTQHPVFAGDRDIVIGSLHPVPIPSTAMLLLSSCAGLLMAKSLTTNRQ